MAKKNYLVDLSKIDFDNPIAEVDEIRDFNPQRHEMEQLSAIVHEDVERKECVGYLDVTDHEFWVRGHMPELPLMPGVMMLEALHQAAVWLVRAEDDFKTPLVLLRETRSVKFGDFLAPGETLQVRNSSHEEASVAQEHVVL